MGKIMVVGYLHDKTIGNLVEQSRRFGIEVEFLDLLRVKQSRRITIRETSSDLEICFDEDTYIFSHFSAFYQRCFLADSGSPDLNAKLLRVLEGIWAYFEKTKNARVINKPSAGNSNGNKLLHLIELSQSGLRTPYAFISSSDYEVRKHVNPDGKWVSKSGSGVRTIVTTLDKEDFARIHKINEIPTKFQRRILGYDVRAHVTLDNYVAVSIKNSDSVDYRYNRSGSQLDFGEIELPNGIFISCQEFLRRSGLNFGGFDFKVCEEGNWYALECNPMPGYDWYDSKVNYKISKLVLDFLNAKPGLMPIIDLESIKPDDPFVRSNRRPKASNPFTN